MSTSPIKAFTHWLPHLAAVLVIVLCCRMAAWQFDRADEKRQLASAWEQAPHVQLSGAGAGPQPYLRVTTEGRFDTERHILLDNQIRAGQAGVHVFTPFRADPEGRLWLVNRGWQPLPSRQGPLPAIETSGERLMLSGRLVEAPRVGRQLGQARELETDHWPQLVTYLDTGRVASALGESTAERVILLDPDHPAHLTGDAWQPLNFGPDRHLAYAWQWITMAVAVFLIWVVLTWRSFRKA